MERHHSIVPRILIPIEQSVASSGGGGGGGEHVHVGGSSGGNGGTVGGVNHSVVDMKAFGPRHFGLQVPTQMVTGGDGEPDNSSFQRAYIRIR